MSDVIERAGKRNARAYVINKVFRHLSAGNAEYFFHRIGIVGVYRIIDAEFATEVEQILAIIHENGNRLIVNRDLRGDKTLRVRAENYDVLALFDVKPPERFDGGGDERRKNGGFLVHLRRKEE